MKTLQTLKASSLLVLFVAFILSLTGCQKDEMPVTNGSIAAPVDMEAVATEQFKMVIIDHAAAGSGTPDYNVQVRSDNKVMFQGRNNTATLGERIFAISEDQMKQVLETINSFQPWKMPVQVVKAELASTVVGYKETKKSDPIYRADNDESQSDLIQMAQKIEDILGIKDYIENDIK